MKSYTLQELLKLKAEYLSTLSDSSDEEFYCTYQELADGELTSFFGWLNIKENTP